MNTNNLLIALTATAVSFATPFYTAYSAEKPFEITGDGPSSTKNGLTTVSDNAVIKYDGITINADVITYDPKSGTARLYTSSDSGPEKRLIATLQIEK